VPAAFFVTLREGLEAALVIGVIVAYLVKVGRRDAVIQVAIGVGLAAAIALTAGIVIVATIDRLPLRVQETFEGAAAITAAIVLTWMLFWMRRQGRAMKGEIEHAIDQALDRGSTFALVSLAFVAVLREGFETVLFLLAILGASGGDVAGALTWAVAGLAVAVGIGVAMFAFGVRINLRTFFTVTGVILIFVAAGLCAYAVRELTEAGWLPITPVAFDITHILSDRDLVGSVLAGLFGYTDTPTWAELVAYFGYLIPVLTLYLWPARKPQNVARVAAPAP